MEGSWAKFKRARSVSLVANGGGAVRGLRALETSVQVRQAQRSGRSCGTRHAAGHPRAPRAFAPRSGCENYEATDEAVHT